VFTLWGAIVAERLGYDSNAALSVAKVMSGLTAQKKGRTLGLYKAAGPEGKGKEKGAPGKTGLGEDRWVRLCGLPVPVKDTPEGVRGVSGDQPVDPAHVREYLESKFGEDLPRVRQAMEALAGSRPPEDLAAAAYQLYERFRPAIPPG
jgi:hypothetical protein